MVGACTQQAAWLPRPWLPGPPKSAIPFKAETSWRACACDAPCRAGCTSSRSGVSAPGVGACCRARSISRAGAVGAGLCPRLSVPGWSASRPRLKLCSRAAQPLMVHACDGTGRPGCVSGYAVILRHPTPRRIRVARGVLTSSQCWTSPPGLQSCNHYSAFHTRCHCISSFSFAEALIASGGGVTAACG